MAVLKVSHLTGLRRHCSGVRHGWHCSAVATFGEPVVGGGLMAAFVALVGSASASSS
jgi:hypothetical protein